MDEITTFEPLSVSHVESADGRAKSRLTYPRTWQGHLYSIFILFGGPEIARHIQELFRRFKKENTCTRSLRLSPIPPLGCRRTPPSSAIRARRARGLDHLGC